MTQENPELLQNPAHTCLPNRDSHVTPPDLEAAGSHSKHVWSGTLTGLETTGQSGPARPTAPVLTAWRQEAIKPESRHFFFYSVKYTDKEEDGDRVETVTPRILMSSSELYNSPAVALWGS